MDNSTTESSRSHLPGMGYHVWVLAVLLCGTWCQGTMVRLAFRECYPATPGLEYTVASEVVCAAIAHLTNGMGYSYTYRRCTVFGPHTHTDGDSTIFVPVQNPLHSEDVAFKKPTKSSGHMNSLFPSLAVDGDDLTMYHSLTPYENPWWVVDFLGFYTVNYVLVLPRKGAYAYRFSDIELRIGHTLPLDGDFSSWQLFHFYAGPYNETEGRLNFTSSEATCGRFLSMQRVSSGAYPAVHFMDVKAFASTP